MPHLVKNISFGQHKKRGLHRLKKPAVRIDMTPLVDLGFLLIAFFVVTAELSQPAVTDLVMPKDGDSTKLKDATALTVLVDGDNKIFYYAGNFPDAVSSQHVFPTDFSAKGIGRVIRERQQWLDAADISTGKRDDLMVMVKATGQARYKNVMDVLDEILIHAVRRYAILDPEKSELSYLQQINR